MIAAKENLKFIESRLQHRIIAIELLLSRYRTLGILLKRIQDDQHAIYESTAAEYLSYSTEGNEAAQIINTETVEDPKTSYLEVILAQAREIRLHEQNLNFSERQTATKLKRNQSLENPTKQIQSRSIGSISTRTNTKSDDKLQRVNIKTSSEETNKINRSTSLKSGLTRTHIEKNIKNSVIERNNPSKKAPSIDFKNKNYHQDKKETINILNEVTPQIEIIKSMNHETNLNPLHATAPSYSLISSRCELLDAINGFPTFPPSALYDMVTEHTPFEFPGDSDTDDSPLNPSRTSDQGHHGIVSGTLQYGEVSTPSGDEDESKVNENIDRRKERALSMTALAYSMRRCRLQYEATLKPTLYRSASRIPENLPQEPSRKLKSKPTTAIVASEPPSPTSPPACLDWEQQREHPLGRGLASSDREAVLLEWILARRHLQLYEQLSHGFLSSRRKAQREAGAEAAGVSSSCIHPSRREESEDGAGEDLIFPLTQSMMDGLADYTPLDMKRLLRPVSLSQTPDAASAGRPGASHFRAAAGGENPCRDTPLPSEREAEWKLAIEQAHRFHDSVKSRVQYAVESGVGRACLRPVLKNLKECCELVGANKSVVTNSSLNGRNTEKQMASHSRGDSTTAAWVEALKSFRTLCSCLNEKSEKMADFVFVIK